MSSFFEDLNDLVIETPAIQVIGVTLLILAFAGAVGLAIAYWITR
jgi:hypothetical protein